MKTIPTIEMVMEAYQKFAAVERMRMERPCEKTVESAVGGTRRLCEIGGISLDQPISVFSRRKLEHIADIVRNSSLRPITLWSYLYALRKLFARWTHRYYAEIKWTIPQLELPPCRRQSPRYIRPDQATIAKVKEWYNGLEKRKDGREWVLATLMLEFAMRNGDAERLRWADFRPRRNENYMRNNLNLAYGGDFASNSSSFSEIGGLSAEGEREDLGEIENSMRNNSQDGQEGMILCYTPHKTRLTSGRVVAWPVHPEIWQRLCVYREAGVPYNKRKGWKRNEDRDSRLVVPCAKDIFARLNRELRVLKIFTGSKACYELRKICVDHIYQKFGIEMASSISGDDIRTVTRYYADPSAVSVEGVRVVDLL